MTHCGTHEDFAMNYLAHLYLARPDPEAMLGALLGDFVFGRSALQDYSPVERREILVHRQVDRYTDTHPLVVAARARFGPGLRRYAGIALDVYYDHCLARDWDRHAEVPLDDFSARFYHSLLSRRDDLPPRLRATAPRSAAHDWLGSYRDRASVDLAVSRIATRLSRNGERLVACLDDLRRHEAAIAAGFDAFFPQLVAHVLALRRAPPFA
jgi:acyl carrier protein phosphodiesterase